MDGSPSLSLSLESKIKENVLASITTTELRLEEITLFLSLSLSRLQGKQGKMKEMYQQAVAGSERVTKINAAEEIQHSTHARSIKERFERGEPIAASDDETDSKPKPEKADEEVIAAGAFYIPVTSNVYIYTHIYIYVYIFRTR